MQTDATSTAVPGLPPPVLTTVWGRTPVPAVNTATSTQDCACNAVRARVVYVKHRAMSAHTIIPPNADAMV